jgi:hypothetical protein
MLRTVLLSVAAATIILGWLDRAYADWVAGRDLAANEQPDGSQELINPNPTVPAWSYGFRSTAAGAGLTLFSAAAGHHSNDAFGYTSWDGWSRTSPDGPNVLVNASGSPISRFISPNTLAPLNPLEINMHPGQDLSVSVIRWTAPAGGSFQIAAGWRDLDTVTWGGSDDGFAADIVVNGISVFHQVMNNGGSTSTNSVLSLNIGDLVDFVTAARGFYGGDSTAFDARIVASVAGDYNNNGTVDAADYVLWRKYQGTTHTLPNDPTGGTIGTAQFTTWRSHFGQPSGSGSGATGFASAAVPEPSTLVLLMFAAASWCLRRSRAA